MMLVVEGYGPKSLVDMVRNSIWLPCIPNEAHFTGIDFKGNLIVRLPDLHLSQKYQANFFEIPRGSGDELEIIGYQSENLLEQLKRNQGITVSFGEKPFILESNNHFYQNAYRLLIDKI